MTVYDVYGTRDQEIDALLVAIEAALGVSFRRHEYDWYGGDYFRTDFLVREQFVLVQNHVETPDGDEVLEPGFPDYAVILRVERTGRADDIRHLLEQVAGLNHLSREAVSPVDRADQDW